MCCDKSACQVYLESGASTRVEDARVHRDGPGSLNPLSFFLFFLRQSLNPTHPLKFYLTQNFLQIYLGLRNFIQNM